MADQPHKFIAKEYLPDGLQIREPSKMHYVDVRHLCDFLCHRQMLGQKIFWFQHVLPQHLRGKASRQLVSHQQGSEEEPSLSSENSVKRLSLKKGKAQEDCVYISTE